MKSIRKSYSQDKSPGAKNYPITPQDPAGERNLLFTTLRNTEAGRINTRDSPEDVASIESLAKVIIHEIRNPLTAISLVNQSLLEEIQHGDLPSTLNPFTAIISKNINRIECLLKDLLYLNAASESEFVLTDLCDVIERSLEKADDRIFLKKVEVTRSYNQGIFINGDAEKLSVAFLNLIVNAIEAVRENEGKIWITVYRVKNEVRVVFKDNGLGMEPDVAMRMFDKNFSGKATGLGVGLTHVKEILEEHHASVSVSSEPDTGTLIVVRFKTI